MIQYVASNAYGSALGVENAGDQFIIKVPGNNPLTDEPYDWVILPITVNTYKGTAAIYFMQDGWTASYSPKLKAWISFHDYTPYKYTYTSSGLYSFREFPDFLGNSTPIHSHIYKHHYTGMKGNFYGRQYPTEIEVIHNEEKFVNKLFYNFCWITDRLGQAVSSFDDWNSCADCGVMGGSDNAIPDVDATNNLLMTKTHGPGFDEFILYNSHQTSGLQNILELVNARKNGCEWCLNKFRDITKNEAFSLTLEPPNAVGGNNLYYSLFTPQPNSAQYTELDPSGVTDLYGPYFIDGNRTIQSLPPNQLPLFINSDMHEIYNSAATLQFTKDAGNSVRFRPRKMVDKWLAIRLITRNRFSFLVNLYSTEVGARKFNRHERNKK